MHSVLRQGMQVKLSFIQNFSEYKHASNISRDGY